MPLSLRVGLVKSRFTGIIDIYRIKSPKKVINNGLYAEETGFFKVNSQIPSKVLSVHVQFCATTIYAWIYYPNKLFAYIWLMCYW